MTTERNFFANPLVGVLGTIASIIGLFLACYFYFQSKEEPDLVYYVIPLRLR